MKSKNFFFLFVVGLLIRLIVAVTTYHQDLGAIALSGKYILQGQALSFYSQSTKDASKTIFNYQPLAYLIPGLFYFPFSSLVIKTAETYLNSDWQKNYHSSFNFWLLLYKYPMILADFLIFVLLGHLFFGKPNRHHVQLLWWLNPIPIFVSSFLGQVDIFIALFLALALYFLSQENRWLCLLSISLSALVKPVGLVLLPLVVNKNSHTSLRRLIDGVYSTIAGGVFYLLGILPYFHLPAYRYFALFAEQMNKSTYSGINIASGTTIPFFFIFLALIYVYRILKNYPTKTSMAIALMSSLVFSHFHPQWLVWVLPLLIVVFQDLLLTLAFSLSWLGVLLSFDSSLHLGGFINSTISFSLSVNGLLQNFSLMSRATLVALFLYLFQNVKTKE